MPIINLFNQNCNPAMKEMEDNCYQLCIVDPPYGINVTNFKIKANKKNKKWDNEIPTKEYFDNLFRISKNQIIWGMNFLNNYLPRCEKTLIWDKQNDGTFGSDYELAWTSFAGCKQHIYRIMWYGYFYPKNELPLIHPTQKPIKLYKWLLLNYAKKGDKILDTHGGSMSLVIACIELGFDIDCYEIDKDYFQDAKKRILTHVAQLNMFNDKPVINFYED